MALLQHGDPAADEPDARDAISRAARSPGVWPGTFAFHWLAALYVVVEGWQELGLDDPEINDLVQRTDYVDGLRRFRNTVYHFQREGLLDPRVRAFHGQDLTDWAVRLTHAFRDFFARSNDRTSSVWAWVDQDPES